MGIPREGLELMDFEDLFSTVVFRELEGMPAIVKDTSAKKPKKGFKH